MTGGWAGGRERGGRRLGGGCPRRVSVRRRGLADIAAQDLGNLPGADEAGTEHLWGILRERDDRGFDPRAARAAIEHVDLRFGERLPDVLGGRGRDAAGWIGAGADQRPAERFQEREGDVVGRAANRDGGAAARHEVRD